MPSTVWTLLLAVLTFVPAVLGQRYPGYNFGPDLARRVKRHTYGPWVVRNLAQDDGDLPLRQEIRILEKDTDQWTLYLLGLSMMQFANQSDPISWYQITGMGSPRLLPTRLLLTSPGIHGVPFQTWGGVKPKSGSEMTGYCTHISVLFPTWHRPYVSLYEVRPHTQCLSLTLVS